MRLLDFTSSMDKKQEQSIPELLKEHKYTCQKEALLNIDVTGFQVKMTKSKKGSLCVNDNSGHRSTSSRITVNPGTLMVVTTSISLPNF